MIFSSCGIYAQLHVSPSDKSDSYLYVKDRVLYVQNGIDLMENRRKETQASIYLRKEAQLLQGPKNKNLNSGDGKISVFQEGTSNAFDYNYWGLPVKLENDKNIKLNDIIYEPLDKTESRKANLISGLDGNSRPLNISSKWIYTFSGHTYSNWQYAGDHFDLYPGEGFSMKGVNGINPDEIEGKVINSGSAQTYDFRGLPNDGRIELSIAQDQLLLVGNPYPSVLNLDDFLIQNTATTGIAYFWDSRENGTSHYLSDYEGGYGAYSPGAGIYVPAIFKNYPNEEETGESGDVYVRKFSPIGQGFMVIGKTTGKVVFENSQRYFQKENRESSQFRKVESNSNEIPSLRLNVQIDSIYTRQLVLAFNENATIGEDHAMDARKLDGVNNDISWNINNEDFVINVLPKKDEELIPLKLSLKKESVIHFSAADFNNFNPDRLFIYDTKEDLYYSIKTGYLKLKLPSGDYPNRFFVSFIEKLPLIDQTKTPVDYRDKPAIVLLNTFDIYQNNRLEQLEVKVLYETDIRNIRLYDLNGKLLFNQKINGNQKEYYLPTGNLSTAVYIVKVNTSDNIELTKKIGIKN